MESLAEAAHRTGAAECTVFSMGESPGWDVPDAVSVPITGGAAGRRLTGSRALAQTLREHPVDIIVNMGNEVTQVHGIPTILWPMTVAPLEEAAIRRLSANMRSAIRWRALRSSLAHAVSQADAYVFNSHYARALYSDAFDGVSEKPSAIIKPGVSLPPGTISSKPFLSEGIPYILAVSHLYPYKMVVEMIKGYSEAVAGGIPHHLVIAGKPADTFYSSLVEGEVARLHLSERVHLLGDVEASTLRSLYVSASFFISPSISENAGSFTLLDAFAHSLPVLASSTSSMPEICQDAVRYFDPRDPAQLGTEIVRLVNDVDLRTKLAKRGFRQYGELPSWDEVASSLADFAREVRVCSAG